MIALSSLSAQTGVQFGTSGVRGLVAQMSADVCKAYTLAFIQCLALKPGQRVAVGIDLRPSSPDIALACMDAIIESGCVVDYCGHLPTPALALYALQESIAAVMVTGSHIPFDRNGIKFYRADGEITKADEAAICSATVAFQGDFLPDRLPAVNPLALARYTHRYRILFSPAVLTGWRVGVYQHSSVARDCLLNLLEALGAMVVPIERTDHFVPIDTEAVSEADEERARQWVRAYGLDAIVTTDGDGDRPLIADETGQWLRGDIVGLLTAQYLGARSVVTPVSCNTAIERSGVFETVLRTRIGSPYVIAGMQSLGAECAPVAGFEANGGFIAGPGLRCEGIDLDPLPTRDALLPISILLVMAAQEGVRLSSLTAQLPKRFTASDRIQSMPTALSLALMAKLKNNSAILQLENEALGSIDAIDDLDGIRLCFAEGDIVHLRASGNAPELRCYVEADSQLRAKWLVKQVLAWAQAASQALM